MTFVDANAKHKSWWTSVLAGWLTDKELALCMLQWIMAFAVAGRDQLRHTHVRLVSRVWSMNSASTVLKATAVVASRIWE
jgi:hypothetical protein